MAGQSIAAPSADRSVPPGEPETPEQHFRRLTEEDPANAEAWSQLGLLALRQGRHPEAVELLEKAAALDGGQPTVHHHLASAYQALGKREQAVRCLHQVVCLRPESADAHNAWGIALARSGRLAEAVAAFDRAVQLRPEFPEAHNNWGNALAEQGQSEQALEHFRQALSLHPAYPEGHNNLGLALARLRRNDEAVAALKEARKLNPGYAEAHGNLGNLYRDMGKLDDALACFREVVRLRPENPEPRFQLALTLARMGKHEEAIAGLHQCLLFQPDMPEPYHHLGNLLSQRDRLEEATAAYRQAVRLKPDSADFLNNLGNALLRQQKTEEAVGCFLWAVQVRGDYPPAYCNLGSALMEQGKFEEAAGRFQEAVRLRPDYLEAHFNLGNALRKLRRYDEALAGYRRVLELQPEHAGARLNTGVVHAEQGRLDEAAAIYTELQRRKPDFAEAYNCLGIARLHQGRAGEALAQFDRGLQRKPDDPEIHLNRALCLLLMGDYERGWQEYEWRWKLKKAAPRPYPQPVWDGGALPQGTLVLWAEQGMGDILQFIRYAPLVKERVGKVLLDCPGALRGLLASCPGIDALVGAGAAQPAPDVHAPLLSLPRILGTTLATTPASVPYLFVDADRREQWRQKVGAGRGLKVGIVWQGNPLFTGDRYRSVSLARFRPLADVPGIRLFSLQKGKGAEQLAGPGAEMRITDLGGQITGDYRDTAAAIVNLDLVVSVDTSVAHLAGALGVPVWILLPINGDWRWLQDREDSVWYPGARLFRQRRWGDWDEVFARVAGALQERARRPIGRRAAVQMELADLVELLVVQEVQRGSAEEVREALGQAGLEGIEEVNRQAARLKAAHAAIEEVKSQMRALALANDVETRAAEVVRRFARAEQEREEAMAELSAWLAGGGGR